MADVSGISFSPPTVPLRSGWFDRLWSHYPLDVGVTLIRGTDGLYRSVMEPCSPDVLAAADMVFLGGYVYRVSPAVAAELVAAGYGARLVTDPGEYGLGPFGTGVYGG